MGKRKRSSSGSKVVNKGGRKRSNSSPASTETPSTPAQVATKGTDAPEKLSAPLQPFLSAPEVFLEKPKGLTDRVRGCVARLYDYQRAGLVDDGLLDDMGAADTLDTLHVEEMEPEQVWAQMEILNDPLHESLEVVVKSLIRNRTLSFDREEEALMPESKRAKKSADEEFDEEEFARFMELEDNGEFSIPSDEHEDHGFGELEGDAEEDSMDHSLEMDTLADGDVAVSARKQTTSAPKVSQKKKKSSIEDDFLDLDDMERFVEEAEKIEQGIAPLEIDEEDEEAAMALLYGEGGISEDEDEDEDEGDDKEEEDDSKMDVDKGDEGFFDNTEKDLDRLLDEIEEADGITSSTKARKGKSSQKKVVSLKYDDWFAKPNENRYSGVASDSEDSVEEEEKALERGMSKYEREQMRLRNQMQLEERLLMEGDDEEASLSRHAKKQERMKKKIASLEEQNLAKRPWQLMGESLGRKRPMNSLLEENLEFEYANKVAPVVTQAVTKSIEDMIKYRIINQAFDDVIRRVFEDDHKSGDYRESAIELDSTKSKKGLAELYEDKYRQADDIESIDPKQELKDELGRLFKAIVYKLDALCNFQAAPRRTKDAVDIKALKSKNASSITMEEITPSTVSNASLFTPEEIYKRKKGSLVAQSEMEREDKQRIRRGKKSRYAKAEANREQKRHERKRAVMADETEEERGRREQREFNQQSMEKAKEELRKANDKNIVFAENTDSTNYGRSTALFGKLQQEAAQEAAGLLNSRRQLKKKKKKTNESAGEVNRYKL